MPRTEADHSHSQPYDPKDRIGTKDFLKITRLGRTTFFQRFRRDPYWEERFDIRVDELTGHLHMSREAAVAFALERRGDRGRSPRADRLGHYATRSQRPPVPSLEGPVDQRTYGSQLAALVEALNSGAITERQFKRAVADLEG